MRKKISANILIVVWWVVVLNFCGTLIFKPSREDVAICVIGIVIFSFCILVTLRGIRKERVENLPIDPAKRERPGKPSDRRD